MPKMWCDCFPASFKDVKCFIIWSNDYRKKSQLSLIVLKSQLSNMRLPPNLTASSSGVWLLPGAHKSNPHLLIKKECAVYALEGWFAGTGCLEGVCVYMWGGSLMGKSTLVCGDMLMFNHKWPPDAGSHKPAPLLITSALKRLHCTLYWASLWASPAHPPTAK